jgi:predicted Zn-dependent protease
MKPSLFVIPEGNLLLPFRLRVSAPAPLVVVPAGNLLLPLRLLVLALALAFIPTAHPQDFDTTTHTTVSPQAAAREAANQAIADRDFAKALKLLTPLAEASPKDAALLYDLASAQDALDQTSAAETSYRAAIAADPDRLEPHVALGLLLARNGHMDDARTELLAAVKMPAGDPLLKARAFRALARIDQQARPDQARDELLEALKLSPETREDTLLTAELAAKTGGSEADAEAALRRLLAQKKNDPEASAALARFLIEQERNPEAETLLTQSLAANPDDTVLTVQLATLLNDNGKPADALPLVEKLHTAHPEDANIAHLLAGLYLQTQDYAHAEPLYAALLVREPKDPLLLEARGEALLHLKRFADAQDILSQAVAQPTLFPEPSQLAAAASNLALAASENDDPAACLQALQIRASVVPPSPTALFLGAISEDKLHHISRAREAYRSFIKASNGAFPDQEFEAQHRLIALEHMK